MARHHLNGQPCCSYDPGKLRDNDLELVLVEKYPGDATIGYVPAYRFKMTLVGKQEPIGH